MNAITPLSRTLAAIVLLALLWDPTDCSAQEPLDRWVVVDSLLFTNGSGTFRTQLTGLEYLGGDRILVTGKESNMVSFVGLSTDGGQSWRQTWSDSLRYGPAGLESVAKEMWDLGLLPNGTVVVLLDSGVLTSVDGGESWNRSRLPLGNAAAALWGFTDSQAVFVEHTERMWFLDDATSSSNAVVIRHPRVADGYMFGNVVARNRQEWLVNLGKGEGTLFSFTTDGGATWTDVGPFPDLVVAEMILDESGVVWIAGKNYGFSNNREIIGKSEDFGRTWSILVDTLPPGRFSHGLLTIDDWKRSLRVAGGYDGVVWRSLDRGATWRTISEGLASDAWSSIRDIAIADERTYYAVSNNGNLVRYRSSVLPASAGEAGHDPFAGLRLEIVGSRVRILTMHPELVELEVYDGGGRLRSAERLNVHGEALSSAVEGLPAGSYFVVATAGNRRSVLQVGWRE